jgi:hypothetical protein
MNESIKIYWRHYFNLFSGASLFTYVCDHVTLQLQVSRTIVVVVTSVDKRIILLIVFHF